MGDHAQEFLLMVMEEELSLDNERYRHFYQEVSREPHNLFDLGTYSGEELEREISLLSNIFWGEGW